MVSSEADGNHVTIIKRKQIFKREEGRVAMMVVVPCLFAFKHGLESSGRCTCESVSHVYTPESGVTGYPNPGEWIMLLTHETWNRDCGFGGGVSMFVSMDEP